MGSTLCAWSHKACGRKERKTIGRTLQRQRYNTRERYIQTFKSYVTGELLLLLLCLSRHSSYVLFIHDAFEALTVLQLTSLLCYLHWSPDCNCSSSFARALWNLKQASSLYLDTRSRAACKVCRTKSFTRIHYGEEEPFPPPPPLLLLFFFI